jgi:signal peptidase
MNAVRTAARRTGATLVLLVAFGALATTLAMRLDAIRVSRVLTGSMGAEVPAGSLVVARPHTAERIEAGQVVVFVPPAPFGTPDGRPIVHRVVAVTREGGEVLIRTKGDANAAEDPWTLNASRSTVFRVAAASPLAGAVAGWAGRGGAVVAVGLATLLAAVRALVLIWRPPPRGRRRNEGLAWLRDAAAA